MVFGTIIGVIIVGLLFWKIGSDATETRKRNLAYVKASEIAEKVRFQQFILAGRKLFPQSKLSFGLSTAILVTPLLNTNGKKIGTINLYGNKMFSYSTFYKLTITILVLDFQYKEIDNNVPDNYDIILERLKYLSDKLFSNSELKGIIIATTY